MSDYVMYMVVDDENHCHGVNMTIGGTRAVVWPLADTHEDAVKLAKYLGGGRPALVCLEDIDAARSAGFDGVVRLTGWTPSDKPCWEWVGSLRPQVAGMLILDRSGCVR